MAMKDPGRGIPMRNKEQRFMSLMACIFWAGTGLLDFTGHRGKKSKTGDLEGSETAYGCIE